MTRRRCLEDGCDALTRSTRCEGHERTTSQRGYGAAWQRESSEARRRTPWCALCGATSDLTKDHTSGLVVCRSCHGSERHGGVRRRKAGF